MMETVVTAKAPAVWITSPVHVLLIVDDRSRLVELSDYLVSRRFDVCCVTDVESAIADRSSHWQPDVIVIDLLIPTRDIYTACRRLRTTFGTPIVLSTWGAPPGHAIGEVDAVLARPIVGPELVQTLTELLGRDSAEEDPLSTGPLTLLPQTGRAFLKNREIVLSQDEMILLGRFVRSVDRPVRRVELLNALRGFHQDVDPRVVDVHIVRLMVKLGDHDGVRLSRASSGDGYVLHVNEPRSP